MTKGQNPDRVKARRKYRELLEDKLTANPIPATGFANRDKAEEEALHEAWAHPEIRDHAVDHNVAMESFCSLSATDMYSQNARAWIDTIREILTEAHNNSYGDAQVKALLDERLPAHYKKWVLVPAAKPRQKAQPKRIGKLADPEMGRILDIRLFQVEADTKNAEAVNWFRSKYRQHGGTPVGKRSRTLDKIFR